MVGDHEAELDDAGRGRPPSDLQRDLQPVAARQVLDPGHVDGGVVLGGEGIEGLVGDFVAGGQVGHLAEEALGAAGGQ